MGYVIYIYYFIISYLTLVAIYQPIHVYFLKNMLHLLQNHCLSVCMNGTPLDLELTTAQTEQTRRHNYEALRQCSE